MFSSEAWLANPGANFYNGVATQSLRFDDGSTAYLSRTPSSASNRKTWTWSGWVKRCILGGTGVLFEQALDGGNTDLFYFSSDGLIFTDNVSSVVKMRFVTSAVFRDSSSWYHFVLAVDTTQATDSDRVNLYVNGVLVTSFTTETYPPLNYDTHVNSTDPYKIGNRAYNNTIPFDGYMAEVNFVDGTQLDPTSFGETKNGVWIAKEYTGSYGTNGYRLQFNQTGTGSASSSTIGADTSGNTNHYTSSGIVASDCNMPDSPENNFSTLNPLWNSVQQTYAEGNLKTTSGAQHSPTCSTIGVSSGKWYVEGVALSSSSTKWSSGIFDTAITYNKVSGTNYIPGQTPTNIYANGDAINYYTSGNDIYKNGSQVISNAFSSALTTNDIIQIAFDVDNGKIWYGINNSWNNGTSTQGSFDSGNHDTTFTVQQEMRVHFTGESNNWLANFGQDSSFAGNKTAQGNTDSNGIGDFFYEPPNSFLALCTSNLPEPTISPNADTQADDYFNTVLYTSDNIGADGTQNVTGVGFKPDWVWLKNRTSGSTSHTLYDSNRGTGRHLSSDTTGAEVGLNSEYGYLGTFGDDGYTLRGGSTNANYVNQSTDAYASWNWKANGGTTSSNSDGSITSTVQANTDAGFSIVTYTGNATNGATIGHGLGVKPDMIIFKNRDSTAGWATYHKSLGATKLIYLDLINASVSSDAHLNNTEPTDTLITLHDHVLTNASDAYVAYCFADIEGYSKFGIYTGNGDPDGSFVYTGFAVKYLVVKRTNLSGTWRVVDTIRSPSNVTNDTLALNAPASELVDNTSLEWDLLSNGFKCRDAYLDLNASGSTYIYMAFAENPFKYANAR